MRRINQLVIILICLFNSNLLAQPKNYVRTWEFDNPEVDPNNVATADIKSVRQTTKYMDGLGREIQGVMMKQSLLTATTGTPAGTDIVAFQVYDQFGRNSVIYPAYASTSTNGLFRTTTVTQQSAFMTTQLSGQNETIFNGLNTFNGSPSNLPVKMMPAGTNWAGSNRGKELRYFTNTGNDHVRKWNVTTVANAFGSVTTPGEYDPQTLNKIIIIDENGKQRVQFKDRNGNVILDRVQKGVVTDDGTGSADIDWICTYYVYDNLDRLRAVIQPNAIVAMIGSTWVLSSTLYAELVFRYEYDSRGNLIMKKVPGGSETHMVYDKRGRVILEQDSRLRVASDGYRWIYTKYDNLNRPIEKGLWLNSDTRATHSLNAWDIDNYPNLSSQTYTEISKTFYDDYSWISTEGAALDANLNTEEHGEFSFDPETLGFANPIEKSNNVVGQVTGTKLKVLGASPDQYLYTLTIYDSKGQIQQTKKQNITGGTDIITNQYAFNGKILFTINKIEKKNPNATNVFIFTRTNYDQLWRVAATKVKIKNSAKASSDPGSYRTTAIYQYDKLGQLKVKKLDPSPTALETITYDYNIRGWLLGANRSYVNSTTPAKFGFDLTYDKSSSVISGVGFSEQQFNGNISGMIWRSASDGDKRRYDFRYDPSNRLLSAAFTQNSSGINFDNSAGIDFSVNNISYDNNGNIKGMTQYGWKLSGSGMIDNLVYTYNSNDISNRLKNVYDLQNDPQSKLGDFKTSTLQTQSKSAATIDYTYDENGNILKDRNKDIGSLNNNGIVYNQINLPQEVVFRKAGEAIKGTVKFLYDSEGNKLKKSISEVGIAGEKQTLYIAGIVFENDELSFIDIDEGRIRVAKQTPEPTVCPVLPYRYFFDYFLKDHLGNVRMVLTNQAESQCYLAATLEDASWNTEASLYEITDTRRVTYAGSTTGKVYRTNGSSTAEKTGLGIMLKVMSGDVVTILGKSYYSYTGGAGTTSPLGVLDFLAKMIATPQMPVNKGLSATNINDIATNAADINALLSTSQGINRPKASISYILFDERMKYVSGGNDFVNASGTTKDHSFSANVSKNGYIYIYVSNQNNIDVYFDNLTVNHQQGAILEATEYYPFGLAMAALSSSAVMYQYQENKIKFNGKEEMRKEFSDGSGFELIDFNARLYDAQIGRWHAIDPLSDSMRRFTPYNYGYDNPLRFIDPDGMEAKDITVYAQVDLGGSNANEDGVPWVPVLIIKTEEERAIDIYIHVTLTEKPAKPIIIDATKIGLDSDAIMLVGSVDISAGGGGGFGFNLVRINSGADKGWHLYTTVNGNAGVDLSLGFQLFAIDYKGEAGTLDRATFVNWSQGKSFSFNSLSYTTVVGFADSDYHSPWDDAPIAYSGRVFSLSTAFGLDKHFPIIPKIKVPIIGKVGITFKYYWSYATYEKTLKKDRLTFHLRPPSTLWR